MASTSAGAAPAQEYKVRVSKPAANKRFSIMKFNANLKVDLVKDNPIIMERENNLKQYKTAHDVDILPKFGAGSEFGREQKDEARRKKYGIMVKKYDPNAQPWLMKAGKEKVRNFKGTREGSVSENTSYYIFTQCADGAFEAYPVEDWYAFNPVINYKFLSSEEAEEAFDKRDRTFNYFNVMMRKRLKNEDEDDLDLEEGETKVKAKGKSKAGLKLTELEDWSDSDAEEEDDSDLDEDAADKKAKKTAEQKKKEKKKGFARKNSKKNDLDEAIEESDEGDYDDREVDYITDPSSESETETKKNYEDGGVEDEDGLRKINESGGESEEEEKKEEENSEKKEGEKEKKGSDSESSGPSSGSDDSDPEDGGEFSSALFMMNKKEKKSGSKENSANNSRSSTPVNPDGSDKQSKKRKATESPVIPAKKPAPSSSPVPSPAPASPAESVDSPKPGLAVTSPHSDGISEENIRRYLMRKPMTTKELLQKFRSKTSMTNEQLVATLGQMLKRLNPDKNTVKGKMYLSIKK